MSEFRSQAAKILGSMDEFRHMPVSRQKWLVEALTITHENNSVQKSGTAAALSSNAEGHETLTGALAAHCGIRPDWRLKSNAALLGTLRGLGAGEEEVMRFMAAWRANWRGRDGNPPSLAQIVEFWPAFVEQAQPATDTAKVAQRAAYDADAAETMRKLMAPPE